MMINFCLIWDFNDVWIHDMSWLAYGGSFLHVSEPHLPYVVLRGSLSLAMKTLQSQEMQKKKDNIAAVILINNDNTLRHF